MSYHGRNKTNFNTNGQFLIPSLGSYARRKNLWQYSLFQSLVGSLDYLSSLTWMLHFLLSTYFFNICNLQLQYISKHWNLSYSVSNQSCQMDFISPMHRIISLQHFVILVGFSKETETSFTLVPMRLDDLLKSNNQLEYL